MGVSMVAVRPSSVRAGPELSSEQLGILREGEVVAELERTELGGQVRLRCERGWVSIASRDGTVLLRSAAAGGERAAAVPPPAGRSYAEDLQRALSSLQGSRRAAPDAAPAAFDAESAVSSLIDEARAGYGAPARAPRSPPRRHGSPPASVAVESPGALHARALLDSARSDFRAEQHTRAGIEQRARAAARDAFAAARVPHDPMEGGGSTAAYARAPQQQTAAAARQPQHPGHPVSVANEAMQQHDADLSSAVRAAVDGERAAGEEAFRQQLMALRADAAAQLAQAHAAAQDAATETRIKHEGEMAMAIQETVDRAQQEAERAYGLRLQETEMRTRMEHEAELRRARAGAAVDVESAQQQAAADATEQCRVQHTAEMAATLRAAVDRERAAGEEAFRQQLMALRADAAAQLAQAHAAAQDAATETRIKHEGEMAMAIQETVDRAQQEAERAYGLRLQETEMRTRMEHEAELRRARAGAAVDVESAQQQAAADATEQCRVQHTAEMAATLRAAVDRERAAGEEACAKAQEEAEGRLQTTLQAAQANAERKLKDALTAASIETESCIESAVQAAVSRENQDATTRHLSMVEAMRNTSATELESAVSAALRESLAQAESDMEQERNKSRQARELAVEQARLETTQSERQIAAARLAEAQKETSHHRLQAETLRVKLAQSEASSAARQEDAVRNAQEMARRELDVAISKAARDHQSEMQRAAQQAQLSRAELARELDSVRDVEKTRYDSQISELERSIEGRMQQLHATARAHIEAEVAESLEQTWAELEHAGTMLTKAQQSASSSVAATGIGRARRGVGGTYTEGDSMGQQHDPRGGESKSASLPGGGSRFSSDGQDPAYLRVRSRNLEAARSRARAQSSFKARVPQ